MTTTQASRASSAADVSVDLVQAALRAADKLGRQVADVSVSTIAREAGMSRSTLLRRIGGSRAALDDAVRAAGIDPGGQPVKVRALVAAAELISETGIGLTTLDAIAIRANCSVDSLFAIFGNRDELLAAVFDRYSPIGVVEDTLATDQADFATTVRHVYRQLALALDQEPRIAPALLAEVLARPTSTAVRTIIRHNMPRVFTVIGNWLSGEITAGRIRDLPLLLLINQFAGPLVMHMLLRTAAAGAEVVDLPDIEQTCDIFADAFLSAVAKTNRAG